MALIDNIKVDVGKIHRERVDIIDKFDYSRVASKVSKDLGGLPSPYLQDGIENLKLYYVVALLDPMNAHAVSRPVDPFWHAHILFTKEYSNFCKKVYSGYVHHVPLDETDEQAVAEVLKLYRYTTSVYDRIFHSYDKSWWSDASLGALGPVCLHQEIRDRELEASAIFPMHPEMQRRVDDEIEFGPATVLADRREVELTLQ